MELGLAEIFGILFLLMVMQVIGTHLQVKQYKKAVSRLHKLGNIGIGSRRVRLGAGSIVIIACDNSGRITGGEIMQGITIFNRFKAIDGIVGRDIHELKAEYESLPKKRLSYYKGHIEALGALEKHLEKVKEDGK